MTISKKFLFLLPIFIISQFRLGGMGGDWQGYMDIFNNIRAMDWDTLDNIIFYKLLLEFGQMAVNVLAIVLFDSFVFSQFLYILIYFLILLYFIKMYSKNNDISLTTFLITFISFVLFVHVFWYSRQGIASIFMCTSLYYFHNKTSFKKAVFFYVMAASFHFITSLMLIPYIIIFRLSVGKFLLILFTFTAVVYKAANSTDYFVQLMQILGLIDLSDYIEVYNSTFRADESRIALIIYPLIIVAIILYSKNKKSDNHTIEYTLKLLLMHISFLIIGSTGSIIGRMTIFSVVGIPLSLVTIVQYQSFAYKFAVLIFSIAFLGYFFSIPYNQEVFFPKNW